MTVHAKRDQVVDGIVSEFTSRTEVMDVQIRRTATLLTPPSISHKDLLAKLRVGHSVQSKPLASLAWLLHADFRRRDENICFSSAGKSS